MDAPLYGPLLGRKSDEKSQGLAMDGMVVLKGGVVGDVWQQVVMGRVCVREHLEKWVTDCFIGKCAETTTPPRKVCVHKWGWAGSTRMWWSAAVLWCCHWATRVGMLT